MELRIAVSELTKTLNVMQGIAQRKNTMPILANVLLEAKNTSDGGHLTLSATDLEIGMRVAEKCHVVEEGQITLTARALFDVIKMLSGPDVTIRYAPNEYVTIKSGRTNVKLLAFAADEFPRLPDFSATKFHDLEINKFVEMVQKTLYSTSMDENRYNLSGVYFEPQKQQPNKLVLVSTDGHRLSRIEKAFSDANFDSQIPTIFPKKGLSELVKMLEGKQSAENPYFQLGFSGNQAIACYSNSVLTMRLIDGKFPDYKQVIPNLSDKIIRASRVDLFTSLRRVSVLSDDRNQSVKIVLRTGEMTISCANPESGEISDDIAIEYSGPDMEMGFNVRYMIDALSSMDENNIAMKITDSLSPALLTGMNSDDHLCVVMPMRI